MSAPEGYILLGIVGYTIKGDYDSTATYNRYDTVYYGGSTYYAKHDNLTDVTPAAGNDWGLVCQGAGDMTPSAKGVGRPDNVTAMVNNGVFGVNGAVIPSYVRSGATEFGGEWLSLTSGGSAMTPDTKQMYRIVGGDNDKLGQLYYWDGNAYQIMSTEEMEGATALAGGAGGTVPAPAAGDNSRFLRGDGTWDIPDTSFLAPGYSSLSTYEEGELCTYAGLLYECNAEIGTPEEWNAAHWTQKSVDQLIENKQDTLTFDSTPTEESDNPVTSGGVYAALQDVSGKDHFMIRVLTDDEDMYFQTVTLSDGTGSYIGQFNMAGVADFTLEDFGEYTAVCGGKTLGKITATEYWKTYVLDYKAEIVYGFHLDATESNPASMISYQVQYDGQNVKNYDYTAAAVNLTTGVMNPGSWNLADDYFIPRSCMLKYDCTVDYYLDENDETKKADGTASDVANTSYDGNAMMEWGRDGQKIYLKIVPDSTPTNGATFYFCNRQADSGFHAFDFYDCDGNEIEHFYTPKFFGSLINGKLRSISGQAPYTNGTGQNEVDYAAANNVHGKAEWDTETWGDRILVNALLLMIGKSCNTQAVFGQGYTTGGSAASSLAASGTLNGKGQWYGSSTNNDKTKGVKVFGMEHWWGNIWRRVRGLLNISGTVKYKLTYSQIDGTTQNGYDATGSGYKSVANGTPGGTNGGYANVAVFNEDGIYLKTASGSETTYFCDGLWFNNSQSNYAFVGGSCNSGSHCGALCVGLSVAFSNTAWCDGAALSCKPLAA